MKTLIFDYTLAGHHLEYLNHLCYGAKERSSEEFIFAVPKDEWAKVSEKCSWPISENINWIMLDDKECQKATEGSKLTRCFKLSRFIKRVAIENKVDKIKLISLAGVIPFLPIILPENIKLSGIIYKIYLRTPKSGIRKVLDWIRYTIMAKSRSMESVFILNDPRSAKRLNSIYHTDRFYSLADPVPEPDMSKVKNIRAEMKIPSSAEVFLHFGAMDERKGTLEILKAIKLLAREELSTKYFIFAGRIDSSIKEEFDKLVALARKDGANIIVRNEFCSYELIYSLCFSADCLLTPYLMTDLSSGVLGYAAVFSKPVIGSKSGLIGEIINGYRLGLSIDVSPETISYALSHCNTLVDKSFGRGYIEYNTKDCFNATFLE